MSIGRLIPLLLLAFLVGGLIYLNQHQRAPQTILSEGQGKLPPINCPAAGIALPPQVPTQACPVLANVLHNGPYPDHADGTPLNDPPALPPRPAGFYRQFSVPGTTGLLVSGGTPPAQFWYSADHGRTFVPVKVYP